jgi:Cu/Ag efflux protein CusF
MKPVLACSLALVASLSVAALAGAQSQGMGGMDMKGMEKKGEKSQKAHQASGTVTKVDPQKSSVTIAHGPVQSMNWQAMTMTFKVKDKAMLEKVKQGEKVDFSFVQSGKDYTITQIR